MKNKNNKKNKIKKKNAKNNNDYVKMTLFRLKDKVFSHFFFFDHKKIPGIFLIMKKIITYN